MNNSLKELTVIFKSLGDQNRFRIVKMLQRRSLCVCEIREVLGISQPAVSRHVNILKNAGLLEDAKSGIWTNCRLPKIIKNGSVSAILKYLEYCGDKDDRIVGDCRKLLNVDRKEICAKKFRLGKKKEEK